MVLVRWSLIQETRWLTTELLRLTLKLAVLKRSRGVHSSGDIETHLKTMETYLRAMESLTAPA
jgi:hypothetical protein